jgi:hypothetical protein
MAFLGLDELENLKELQNMQKLDQLQNLDKLREMNHMDQLQNLDKLQDLNKLQDLQHMDNLQNLDKLQHMDQFQHLEKLSKLQDLYQLQEMRHLDQIQHLDRLNLLNRMDQLGQLNQLRDMQYMQSLSNLKSLDKLQVLDRLKVLDRLLELKTLLYVLGFLVPGFIFQEVVSLLLRGVTLKRSLVSMTVYNVINLFACILFVYPVLNTLEDRPFLYYGGWLAILLLVPAVLGLLVAWAIPSINRLYTKVNIPTRMVAARWGDLLSGAATYRVIVTMNNEEKIRGIVSKEIPTPQSVEPGGLYITETSHYDPERKDWQELAQPMGVWVKGTEIKMMEVAPES